ncbi:MAG TPA: metallophosphoesterase [Solirubrobacteraceae bacterium]|nr:metallophosphoesterase [Solirubrobacteraceae bacterium]
MTHRRLTLVLALAAVLAAGVVVALVARNGGSPAAEPGGGPFVASTRGDRAVLWAVGDGADGGEQAKRVARRIAAAGVDRLLYLGDVYGPRIAGQALRPDGSAKDYRDRYASVYGRFATRTAPTPGNHEWRQRAQGYSAYWARGSRRVPPYYGFDTAGWRVLSLNSEAPHGPGSPQLRWLRRQLRRPGTCRLAYWHRPRFSAGSHGDQPDIAPLWDALRSHASVVVNGHDHDMQRFRPIDGITEFVSGAGGHSHYPLRPDPRRTFGNDHTDGALRIELRPGRADLAFVAADGRVLDRHRVTCRAPA